MISNKWIAFIQTLPVFPQIVFKHIYQVGLDSIHKDVAAIRLLAKMLLSKCLKITLKKDCVKILLKCAIVTSKVHMQKQAISALLLAHAQGVFQMQKMDGLRNYFHELLNHFFEKCTQEQDRKMKIEIHKQLVYLIFSIVLDNTQVKDAGAGEQELIDESKLYYFDLIFKYFDTFEEETKNLLLKIYFYRLIGGEKFRESSGKPVFGPLTREENKSGLKHPVKIEESPLLDLLKYSLRYAGKEEHNCLLEFVKILKTKAKLTLDISHVILKVSILNDDYIDIIKEAFSNVFKIPSIQRIIKKASKDIDMKPEICTLLCALLEHSKTSEDHSKIQSAGKRSTHSLIIKTLLELPKDKMFILDKCTEAFRFETLIEVLNEIIDQATEETITEVMDKYKLFMRSILVASTFISSNKSDVGYQPFLDVIYKFVKIGAWKDTIQWKGITIFMMKCKDIVDLNILTELPKEQALELCKELDIPQDKIL